MNGDPRAALEATTYLFSTAEPQHRKVERQKRAIQFPDVTETFHTKHIYPGGRVVGNLKSSVQRAKAQSREGWFNRLGAATSHAAAGT